jgi:hypothetical protein
VVYKIKDSPLVTPLHYDPVVESGLDVTSVANLESPQGVALLWYQQKQYWSVPIAASGPPGWVPQQLGYLASPAQTHEVVPTTVSDVRHDKSYSWVSFDVGRLGSPVEVKIPYFPNWHATGAEGPYLVTPNLMVVVPTSHHVRLSYGATSIDDLGKLASLGGIAAVLGLNIRRVPPPGSFVEPGPETQGADDPEEDSEDTPSDPYGTTGWTGPLPMLPRRDDDVDQGGEHPGAGAIPGGDDDGDGPGDGPAGEVAGANGAIAGADGAIAGADGAIAGADGAIAGADGGRGTDEGLTVAET